MAAADRDLLFGLLALKNGLIDQNQLADGVRAWTTDKARTLADHLVALDEELHREVALKQILDKHAADPVSRARFLLEAEVTGGLEHPGIVPVYGLGTYSDGRPYYAMRFIKGDSLKEAEDVERWMADEPVSAWREPLSRRARRWAKRNRTVGTAAAVALLAGVVGLAAVLVVQTQAKAEIAQALGRETSANKALTIQPWPSARSWPTTTLPSLSSESTSKPATSTLPSCSGRQAG